MAGATLDGLLVPVMKCALCGLVVTLLGMAAWAAEAPAQAVPEVYTWDPQLLAQSRQRVRQVDGMLAPAVAKLRADADSQLRGQLVAVTDKSDELAEAVGGKHNYASLSRYAWPDEKDPKAPWVIRDGKPNNEAMAKFDGPRLATMVYRVTTCSQAYYFTGEKRYAAYAAAQLRRWFLDPETRMNPYMEYAQCVPNKSKGNPWGIIDANGVPYMLDAVMLLADSGEWSPQDQQALQAWFAQFVEWLSTSPMGRSERAATNNHGTFYDLLLARSAIFSGNEKIAREVVGGFGPTRIATQIQPDGSTPREQARVDAAMYTCWNLKGMADMLLVGRRMGVDLWKYEGPQGQSLRKAALWLKPYIEDPTWWKYGDGRFSAQSPGECFRMLAATTHDPEITELFRKYMIPAETGEKAGKESWRLSRMMLLFPVE